MYRGTTAQLVFQMPESIELETMTDIWITIKNLGGKFTYKLADGKIEVASDESKIILNLDQTDTLELSPGKSEVQIRMSDGSIALCTNICEFYIKRILQDGVI